MFRENKRLRGDVIEIWMCVVRDFRRISRNHAFNRKETDHGLSVQIRILVDSHIRELPDPADTKLYSDRETTTQLSKGPAQSAFIRVDPCPIEMLRWWDGGMVRWVNDTMTFAFFASLR